MLSHRFLQSVAPGPGPVPQLNLFASPTSTMEGDNRTTLVVIGSNGDSSSVRTFYVIELPIILTFYPVQWMCNHTK